MIQKWLSLQFFWIQYVLASSYSGLPSGAVPKGMNNEGEPTLPAYNKKFPNVPKGMNNEGEPTLPKLHFMKNTRKAFGVITLPLRAYKPTIFNKLEKASGCSSPLEGERASDCNGSCTSGAVRGQKSPHSQRSWAKEKIFKINFIKKTISWFCF